MVIEFSIKEDELKLEQRFTFDWYSTSLIKEEILDSISKLIDKYYMIHK